MISPLLALFNRALRQDARSKSTYLARGCLVVLMLFMINSVHQSSGWSGAPGLTFFGSAIMINFFLISLAGMSYFASAITEEKEETTLGLLRMTNLNPLSILLGKSTSRLFGGLLLLVAQLPFTLLAVSLGGIGIWQILAAYCALAAYVIFLSNAALLASVICARTASAALLTGFFLFLFLWGSWVVEGILALLKWMSLINDAKPGPTLLSFLTGWEALSPWPRFNAVLRTGFSGDLLSFQFYGDIVVGLVLFLLAWVSFNAFCSGSQEAAATPRGLWLFKRKSRLRALGAGRAWGHALVWKEFYFSNGGKLSVLLKLGLYPLLIWLIAVIGSSLGNPIKMDMLGFTTLWTMGFGSLLELAIVAGRVFRQERRAQTLSSLAMLPVPMSRVAYQKLLGCFMACWPPGVFFFAGGALVMISDWKDITHGWHDFVASGFYDREFWIGAGVFFGILSGLLFFLHLIAFFSLRLKWGALPMAIVVMWGGCTISIPLTIMTMGRASAAAVPLAFCVGCILLHTQIGQRLEQLAAEE